MQVPASAKTIIDAISGILNLNSMDISKVASAFHLNESLLKNGSLFSNLDGVTMGLFILIIVVLAGVACKYLAKN